MLPYLSLEVEDRANKPVQLMNLYSCLVRDIDNEQANKAQENLLSGAASISTAVPQYLHGHQQSSVHCRP